MSPKRLVLFDIDGTILWGGPLWKECFLAAIEELHPNTDFPRVSFGGKTDIQITREMLAALGLAQDEVDARMKAIIDQYLQNVKRAIPERAPEVKLLPGVREIIEELARHPDVLLGLLTGNVREGAKLKLSCVGLEVGPDGHFRVGVYGDDHWDRYELPAMAVDRTRHEHGHVFSGKQVVIIGDTIHDVNCGKSIGARSIGVGTGRTHSQDEMLAQNPDYYFRDLSDTFEVLQAILEELED